MDNEFMTMKELGQLFDKTSHQIGKKLKELGLRTSDGKPSKMAFESGLCKQRWTKDGMNYCWAWHGDRAVRLLQGNGLGKNEQPEDCSRP